MRTICSKATESTFETSKTCTHRSARKLLSKNLSVRRAEEKNMNKLDIEYLPRTELTWKKTRKLFFEGVAQYPHAIEDGETGRWELWVDLGDPDEVAVCQENLMVLAVIGSEKPMTWSNLDALRRALRKAGYQGGLRVDFLSV